MSISFDRENGIFKLDTIRTTYAFKLDPNGRLAHLYYGERIKDANLNDLYQPRMRSFCPYPEGLDPLASPDMLPQEFAGFGAGDYRVASAVVRNADGDDVTDPRYSAHRIFRGKPALEGLPATFGDNADTLEITMTDRKTGMDFILLFSVFDDADIVARSVRAVNRGDRAVRLRKLASCTLDFASGDLDFIHLWGTHTRERCFERREMLHGIQKISSQRGLSSHQHSPNFAVAERTATESAGMVWGVEFVYSGNFAIETERDQFDALRTQTGIDPETFEWQLEPGEAFQAPEAILTVSASGLNGMSLQFHDAIRGHLLRSAWKNRKRPILVNNWEATYFNFDTEKLLGIARDAAELGIEMLVLDDGWFGRRDVDNNSLGDWFVYEKKLPGGLTRLVSEVNKLGLKFGLWFEPEMVSRDSELFRAHPDWCLQIPGRTRSEGRWQLVLDFSRPEVVEHIFNEMCAVLDSANIEYIKWDANRHLTEVASAVLPPERQKEVFHRYMLGVYSLHERLIARYPELLIEGCSGGGGRFDAGMLYYVPQIWTSDNSDAIERLKIQYSTSLFFPCSTMGAHVSDVPNHQTGRITPFFTRGVVAMSGTFGYELDLNKMTEEERKMIRTQVGEYHRFNHLVSGGDLYRLISPFDDPHQTIWMTVAKDKSEFLLNYVQSRVLPCGPQLSVKLRGLDAGRSYINSADGKKYSGEFLMKAGFPLPPFGWNSDGESMRFYFTEEK